MLLKFSEVVFAAKVCGDRTGDLGVTSRYVGTTVDTLNNAGTVGDFGANRWWGRDNRFRCRFFFADLSGVLVVSRTYITPGPSLKINTRTVTVAIEGIAE